MLQLFCCFYAIDSAVAEYQQSAIPIEPVLLIGMLRTSYPTYPSRIAENSFDLTDGHPKHRLAFDG
jgi:hypothetical protein